MISDQNFSDGKYSRSLFQTNNSFSEYVQIVTTGQSEQRTKQKPNNTGYVYYEVHHIVPKSLGGNNKKANLVLLTAKEHFRCHYLLIDFVVGNDRSKMCNALWRMVHGNNGQRRELVDPETYEMLKTQRSLDTSRRFKGKPLSEETKKKMSEAKKATMTNEHKQIISKTHKGKTPWNKGIALSDETKNKLREAKLGSNNSFYGAKHTEETKQKMSEKRKGKPAPNKKSVSDTEIRLINEKRIQGLTLKSIANDLGYGISVIRRVLGC